MKDKIYVAKLGKAVGLKGQLRLIMDTDFPTQFKKDAIFTTNKNIQLKVVEFNAQRELIKFDGFNDMDAAKRLTNQELYSSYEDTKEQCELDENEFFWFDIVGCKVIENGQELGVVSEIHRYPLDDYLEINTAQNLVDEKFSKTFLVPYNMENYIVNVDIEKKTIETKNSFEILENS